MNKQYIAGFFDGEGSAMCLTDKRKVKYGTIYRIRPVISISQKHRFMLDKIRDYLGCGHVELDGGKNAYKFICNGHANILKFIESVGGYIIIKKEQIRLLKALIIFKKSLPQNAPYTKEQLIKILDFRDEIHRLNAGNRSNIKLKFSKENILKEVSFVDDIDKWNKDRAKNGAIALVLYQKSRRKNDE